MEQGAFVVAPVVEGVVDCVGPGTLREVDVGASSTHIDVEHNIIGGGGYRATENLKLSNIIGF